MPDGFQRKIATGDFLANRYRIESVLGQGGMGTVFRAHDTLLGLPVALKVLNPAIAGTEEAVQRLKHEVILARRFTHPNACRIYDLGESNGTFYVSMEFIEGRTLDHLLGEKGRFSLDEGLKIVHQILPALAAAHSAGVIHRDLKPQNIMVANNKAYVMDFGISISGDMNRITQTGMVIGTPQYMAPEQFLDGTVDSCTDIYSLGIIFFEMFTGRLPFESKTPASAMFAHVNTAPPLPTTLAPDLPDKLELVILKCLQKDSGKRYQSVDELILSLQDIPVTLSSRDVSEARTHAMEQPLPDDPPPVANPTRTEAIARESDSFPKTFQKSRTPFINVLSILNLLWGLGYFAGFIGNLPDFHHGVDTIIFVTFSLFIISLHFILFRGLRSLKPAARKLQIVYSGIWFVLITACLVISEFKTWMLFAWLFGAALSPLILTYLNKNNIRDLFEKPHVEPPTGGWLATSALVTFGVGSLFVGMYAIYHTALTSVASQNRSHARSTYAEMNVIVKACEAYAVDHNQYPDVETMQQLKDQLQPKYIRLLRMTDGWENEFRYQVSDDKQSYWLGSAGSDMKWEYPDLSMYKPGKTQSYSEDIIYGNFSFLRWSEADVPSSPEK